MAGRIKVKKKKEERQVARGQSKLRGKFFNPTTGKPETQAQQLSRAAPKKFNIDGKSVSKEEFQVEVQKRRFGAKERGQEPIVKPTIDIGGPKKTGLAALREQPTVAGKVAKVATSLKTTVVLGTVLAGLLTAGTITAAGASKAGTAVITRQVFTKKGASIITRRVGGKLTEKTIVGKTATKALAEGATRFATNTKSIGLTKSLLVKAGLAVGVAGMVGTVVGTYPFAEFEFAEATDKIGIATFIACTCSFICDS